MTRKHLLHFIVLLNSTYALGLHASHWLELPPMFCYSAACFIVMQINELVMGGVPNVFPGAIDEYSEKWYGDGAEEKKKAGNR
eukprot:CAMPEP_0182464990 /NCGR_PEP_ID=MMETSP1319-20130603/8942_1 /TAXON_ID=172717 /ORGANISM="Bolidomonas pacifica, Strain RCC208" /LENGTH=82 /DNA_ID=CAMNT_0024664667 /DNA_START=192 /DNA_END=437 /DNA_ORIENTATION=+